MMMMMMMMTMMMMVMMTTTACRFMGRHRECLLFLEEAKRLYKARGGWHERMSISFMSDEADALEACGRLEEALERDRQLYAMNVRCVWW
jgi:hypothetical protein